jgi:hypothetical protein
MIAFLTGTPLGVKGVSFDLAFLLESMGFSAFIGFLFGMCFGVHLADKEPRK